MHRAKNFRCKGFLFQFLLLTFVASIGKWSLSETPAKDGKLPRWRTDAIFVGL